MSLQCVTPAESKHAMSAFVRSLTGVQALNVTFQVMLTSKGSLVTGSFDERIRVGGIRLRAVWALVRAFTRVATDVRSKVVFASEGFAATWDGTSEHFLCGWGGIHHRHGHACIQVRTVQKGKHG